METARNLTTATIEEETISLHEEKASLIHFYLTLKAFFLSKITAISKSKIGNMAHSISMFITSGILIKTFAAVVSLIWLLIIVSTIFLG